MFKRTGDAKLETVGTILSRNFGVNESKNRMAREGDMSSREDFLMVKFCFVFLHFLLI